MAKFWNVNVTSSNGGAGTIFNLKQTMVQAGWTVVKSSDGTTYNSAGDLLTHSGSGAGGMNNHLAWFQTNDPGNRRQYVFQTSGTIPGNFWKILYSELGTFGTGSITVTPTGSDIAVIYGGTPSANGTTTNTFGPALFNNTSGTYYSHAIAFSDPVPGSNVYSFFCFTTMKATGLPFSLIFADGLISGTYHPMDVAPVVHAAVSSSAVATGLDSTNFDNQAATTISSSAWFKYGLPNGEYRRANFNLFITTTGGGARFPTYFTAADPYDGNRWEWPFFCSNLNLGSRLPPYGIKGMLYRIKIPSSADVYPNTINLNTDGRVYLSTTIYMTIPWADGVTPVV